MKRFFSAIARKEKRLKEGFSTGQLWSVKRRKIIGQNVYRLRLKAGITQTELADFVELSTRYIQKIEHGEANITVEVVERLTRKFRCGWCDIVGDL